MVLLVRLLLLGFFVDVYVYVYVVVAVAVAGGGIFPADCLLLVLFLLYYLFCVLLSDFLMSISGHNI